MQWCNSTHQILARNERVDPVWRILVPKEALSHPFLMHGILALSALHLARTHDDHRRPTYLGTAVAHQNQALAYFRESLNDINASNAKAVFAFASIVAIYALGFPHPPDPKDPQTCLDDLLQVFNLSRGVQQVLAQATPAIKDTDWEIILQLDDYDSTLPEEESSALRRLREVNEACGAQDPHHDPSVYATALENLEDMTAGIHGGLTPITVACRWAIKMKASYVEAIREHNPLALVILAHYLAILHRSRPDWHGGLGDLQSPFCGHQSPSAEQAVNFARVNEDEDDEHDEHQQRIEYVYEDLRRKQIPIPTLEILHHTKDGPNQNENTGSMQGIEMFAPRVVRIGRFGGGMTPNPLLEDDGADEEEPEEDDLHE
ncbi:conserved hypothetical protein [Aspergillus terreus NIH2624]|uniref:Uncharacterized protein n=1 Tax=Aspergillus terreus (strain NIH 2624 / FGSC A1156) TaxID=341663 RepID=Q0CWV9_ASPTN|nr:uncharacterized protein ATEG_01825 [Aspergillus terreus NIH2624]EAU38582.1 conserved hypothetical protein [Aspergillus terreus NIH2624]